MFARHDNRTTPGDEFFTLKIVQRQNSNLPALPRSYPIARDEQLILRVSDAVIVPQLSVLRSGNVPGSRCLRLNDGQNDKDIGDGEI